MKFWSSYEKLIRKITYVGTFIAGIMLILLCLLVFTEVILRQFFNVSTMIADEVSGYLLAGSFFLAAAYALQEGAIVRIDILYNKIPLKIRCFVDVFINVVVLGYAVILFRYTLEYMLKSYATHTLSVTILHTPLWIPQMTIPIGCLMLFLSTTVITVKDLLKATGKIEVRKELSASERELSEQLSLARGGEEK